MTKIDILDDEFIIPDVAFKLDMLDGEEKFFLFEMYNGKDTGYIIRQLHKHSNALTSKATHRRYQLDKKKSYTTLLVFQFEGIMDAVIKRTQRNNE